jgi:tetratricopeptide (TPR) repeat protein
MKAWARDVALGLLLTTAIPSAPVIAAQSAEQILLDKASYWRLKDRPDLAVDALQQLLSINPNQPDALYQFGVISVQRGKIKDAQAYLVRLQKAAPASPRVADLENAIRAGQVSPNQLSEARRLAQSGQFAQAAQKYQQTFGGPPPPTFGVEYYMTLAGTAQGWDTARRGLETLVQNSPSDSKAKLALGEVLTFHADTRAAGIHRLAMLSSDAVVGAQALKSWKQALLWLGGTPADRALYSEYLAKFPQDAEIRQHLAEAAKGGGTGPATVGYGDLNRGNLAAAEREFAAELGRDPNDPGALSGLGVVRLRQRRLEQARELLGHAVREYRRVLAANPNDSAAQAGLRGALSAERSAETAGLPQRGAAGAAPVNPARARADQLRAEGRTLEARGDAAGAQAKYLESVAVDPNDPWARLDYARFLAGRGDLPQAFQLVDPAASGGTADSLQAAALFYSEHNRVREAVALVDRIPPAARTADVAAFRERILATAEIERAKQLARSGNRAAARNVLVSLYSRPPQSAEKTKLIADALADIGDNQEALQLARPSAAARDKKAALEYAALLFKAGRDAEAVAYLTQAESSGRITAADRQQLEHIKIDIAVKRADALRERGDVAGAYDQISPLLTAYPNDAGLLLAAGRIYAAGGQNSIAMRFIDAGFHEAPGDIGVIRGAVGGAIVAGDLERARAYLAAGMQASPNNPRLYYLAAEIARANGNNAAAVYDLEVARRLDTQQAGAFEPLPPTAAPPVPGSPGVLPPNPFRQSQTDVPPPAVQLAAADPSVVNADAVADPLPQPPPLQDTARSADSEDLTLPPRVAERPRRVAPGPAAVASNQDLLPASPQLAALPTAAVPDISADAGALPDRDPPTTQQIAQLEPLPPPPIGGYQPASYAPPAAPATPLQPLPPPPIAGYRPPMLSQPAPRDSLELDIERSMAAISSEAGPNLQGGLAFRERSGETGLSSLTEIGLPAEGTFSPFYTGTVRLQAIPTYLDAGRPESTALTRFGTEGLLALNPGTPLGSLPVPADQRAGGVSFNLGYAYQMFAGEIGTTPLGFPVENVVGRLALQWPGPAGLTTAYPTIPLPPITVSHPLQIKVEGIRQPVTDSVLSYAGTRDPLSGLVWGGVVKTGGDALISYDDGFFGMYGGGGASTIEGQSVASNSELEGTIGTYVRPYRTANAALKVGLNLSYLGYEKNLRFFTLGQGGYFSPQNYVNVSVPIEYSGRYERWSWLAGTALGLQTFHENSSPYFPTNATDQGTAQGAVGNLAIYPGRNETGPAVFLNGQVEYQLDNGFSIGGLASVDNSSNYTEGIGKIYLRKSFGAMPLPAARSLTNPLAGSL